MYRHFSNDDHSEFFDWYTIWDILKKTFLSIIKDDLWGKSAEIAYDFIFSLFPGLMLIAAILSVVVDMPAKFSDMMDILGNFLPHKIQTFLAFHLSEILEIDSGGILTVSIGLLVWLASNVVNSLIHNLNESYQISETRSWWQTRLLAIIVVLFSGTIIIASFNVVVFGRYLAAWFENNVGLGWILPWMLLKFRIVIVIIILTFFSMLIYTISPNIHLHWSEVLPGSLLFAVLWMLSTFGFSFYLAHYANYNKTYGALGAVIILLLWMRIVGFIILIGGKLNAEIHKHAVLKTVYLREQEEEIIPL